ncbi:flagellin [Roseibium sp.]|uniref:flagellin n=1 Tax=Roseibium sp. TaxID=1936156 RepID=UPI003B51F2DE
MRVATFHQSTLVLQHAMETQARLASVQTQQASGLKSADYAGLGTDAAILANLEVSVSRSEAVIGAAKETQSRVDMVHATLGKLSDILTKMRATVNGTKTDSQISALQSEAAAHLKDAAQLVNSQFSGRYLFAGSLTEAPPVDLMGYKATSLTTADTSYHKGDSYVQTVRLGPGNSVDYGLTGDRPGFEKTLRALSYVASASPLTLDKLKDVSDLLVSAQDDVIADQSINGATASRLKTFIDNETQYAAEAGKLSLELASVDVAAAAVQAASYNVQLQASFSAIKTLTSLNLHDYLR